MVKEGPVVGGGGAVAAGGEGRWAPPPARDPEGHRTRRWRLDLNCCRRFPPKRPDEPAKPSEVFCGVALRGYGS